MSESKDFNNLESDGILGLSPKSAQKGSDSGLAKHLFVYELKRDRVIEEAVFSVFLGQIDSKDRVETKSKVLFGGWDKSIVDGSYKLPNANDHGISWFNINSEYHWQVGLHGVEIGGAKVKKAGINAFFDSGASQVSAPLAEFETLLAKIKEAGKVCKFDELYRNWYCDCNYLDDEGWPEIKLTLGERTKTTEVYLLGADYLMYSAFWKRCMIRMNINYAFEDTWLMGVPFLQAYYAIHDLDQKKIGLVRINKNALIEVPRSISEDEKSAIKQLRSIRDFSL